MGIGLCLVLLNIYAVIGRSCNMRWSLRPTKIRQDYLISFQNFLCYNKLYKRSISKQHYSQLTGCVTENVAKLSFASE